MYATKRLSWLSFESMRAMWPPKIHTSKSQDLLRLALAFHVFGGSMEEKDRGLEKLGNSDSGFLSLRGSIALILAFC